ncbi:hypothetical protein E8E12_005764 [Didymella heteroderae]|uniref:Uncharacterized protein n=1 Tax=Didymella heteroderae TaxID=1769908 RepID=A0A9P4WRG3_9PLEO|nr:hypothetical protein E8E12_005764 [Didymella heteroderae]
MALLMEGLNSNKTASVEFADNDTNSDFKVEAIVGVLDLLIKMVPNLALSWSRQENEDYRSKNMERLLLELGYSTMHTCAYRLSVRLELSYVLMGGVRRMLLPPLIIGGQSGEDKAKGSIAQCAYDAITLCVDSAMFAQGDEDRWLQQRYGLNRVEVWKALVQGFAHWYMHRSQEFQTIIELYLKDGLMTENDYPTIVFTSGAALLANQLYHTGMLLLLQQKPRFADEPSQNTPAMSNLWHAHRICGIAIQNDIPAW